MSINHEGQLPSSEISTAILLKMIDPKLLTALVTIPDSVFEAPEENNYILTSNSLVSALSEKTPEESEPDLLPETA